MTADGNLLMYDSSYETVTSGVFNGSEMTDEEIFPALEEEEEEDNELSALVTSAGNYIGNLFEDERGNVYLINGSAIYRIYPGEPIQIASAHSGEESDEAENEDAG